ncbi:hypothetical protein SNE40_004606 [Patella caerulea]|uniref:Uncharacterized protein n=1 Tax=Patella caerulea TaxID=87958 RepID=A0AAN8KC95_PATCE
MWKEILLICVVYATTATAFQTCLYTAHCEEIVARKGSSVGHDEYMFCRVLLDVRYCMDVNKVKCQSDTLPNIQRYLDDLFRGHDNCSNASFLGASLLLSSIAFLTVRLLH